jgi:alcohol dehydrogenase (cytochrome c)
MSRILLALAGCVALATASAGARAQPLDMATVGAPPTTQWPTYNGDYTGERFSPLHQINSGNIGRIEEQWSYKITDVGAQRGAPVPVIKATPLMVDGRLYFTIPDNVYAVDAGTGKLLWKYNWVDHGGHLVGNRGVGMYKDMLYFMGPDDWVIALDAATGKERWRKQIADPRAQYFTTTSPLVVKDHLLIGVGGDALDQQGFLLSLDPTTGDIQWRWNSTPGAGEPGIESWPSPVAAAHGGGMTWLPGTFDPETNLIYWGTGNINPVFAGQGRPGANLFAECIVALSVDTGKMAWYFQVSPHDTHDWDNTETPVLIDATLDGRQRKLLAQAARNGFFTVLDRITGTPLINTPYVPLHWAMGHTKRGEPIPDPDSEPSVGGSINIESATNWQPVTYDKDTGLFYVNSVEGWAIYYLTDTSPKPSGYGGTGAGVGVPRRVLQAIDIRTGKPRWTHAYPNLHGASTTVGPGLLSTAGRLLVTGDEQRDVVVYRPDDGRILWHAELSANESNGPITYMYQGRQWLVVGAGDTLHAYALPQ